MIYYEGIDFACIRANVGHCYIRDDQDTLLASPDPPETSTYGRRAVDCPLGASAGFTQLLRGDLPEDRGNDGYQTRETERWLRTYAANYRTNQIWRARSHDDRLRFPKTNYFNGGAHVQPVAGLQIVPSCLAWLYRELAIDGSVAQRIDAAHSARKGEGPVIEAHPRLFLYSAIERLYHSDNKLITCEILNSVAGYKSNDPKLKDSTAKHRRIVYKLLQRNPAWLGQSQRTLLPIEPPEAILASDHAFDAWLAALTAWAHDHHETLDWQSAGISPSAVLIEGHILVLKT